LESEIDSVGRTDLGFFGYARYLLDKDSVYQNITVDLSTSVKDEKPLQNGFKVYQNYPNPFNPSTIISYSIPVYSQVTLKVFDSLGREVLTLVNQEQKAGNYKVTFNASGFSSGIYFYKLTSGRYTQTRKMILLK